MSAGSTLVQHDITKCAPLFEKAVGDSVWLCNQRGLDAVVYEALRNNTLQGIYWAKGREQQADGSWIIVNPKAVVTHVHDARYGWHFFGLAVDVISRSREWDVSDRWRNEVNQIFRDHGLHCGADWPNHPDKPHYQWTKQFNPSDNDRNTFDTGGFEAVWRLNHAI